LVTIIYLGLSLAIQAINIASQATAIILYQQADSISNNTKNMDNNWGYFTFILAASSLSVILYTVLLILKVLKKPLGELLDWLLYSAVLILQFGVATILSIQLRNTQTAYDYAQNQLAALEAAGMTSGTTYDMLGTSAITQSNKGLR
jgi:hypothetical protein